MNPTKPKGNYAAPEGKQFLLHYIVLVTFIHSWQKHCIFQPYVVGIHVNHSQYVTMINVNVSKVTTAMGSYSVNVSMLWFILFCSFCSIQGKTVLYLKSCCHRMGIWWWQIQLYWWCESEPYKTNLRLLKYKAVFPILMHYKRNIPF